MVASTATPRDRFFDALRQLAEKITLNVDLQEQVWRKMLDLIDRVISATPPAAAAAPAAAAPAGAAAGGAATRTFDTARIRRGAWWGGVILGILAALITIIYFGVKIASESGNAQKAVPEKNSPAPKVNDLTREALEKRFLQNEETIANAVLREHQKTREHISKEVKAAPATPTPPTTGQIEIPSNWDSLTPAEQYDFIASACKGRGSWTGGNEESLREGGISMIRRHGLDADTARLVIQTCEQAAFDPTIRKMWERKKRAAPTPRVRAVVCSGGGTYDPVRVQCVGEAPKWR